MNEQGGAATANLSEVKVHYIRAEDARLETIGNDLTCNINADQSLDQATVPANDADEAEDEGTGQLLYSIDDNPPWYLAMLLGLQVGTLAQNSV